MTEWTIGWLATGFVSFARWMQDENASAVVKPQNFRFKLLVQSTAQFPQRAMIVFCVWCSCGVFHLTLPGTGCSELLMGTLAVWGACGIQNMTIGPLKKQQKIKDSPKTIHSRLIELRLQLQRLYEKERLSLRLEKAEQSQMVMDRYDQRFQIILVAIENHLTFGDHERAERIITLFSRHLRHILYEGSVPFLTLKTTIDHIKTHLKLMELLTAGRFNCDIDDGMLESTHLMRCTESLRISPWVESMVWPFFEWAERNTGTLEPMHLFLDVLDGEVCIVCSHPGILTAQTSNSHRLKLLGNSQDINQEIAAGSPFKVVA
jgi:hypothetical protein